MNEEDHDFTQEQLSSYLDGEVSKTNREIIKAHLETCEECRADLELLKTVAETLADSDVPPLPDQSDTRLLDAIREADGKEKDPQPVFEIVKRPLWARPWVSAAAGLAAVFLVVVVVSIPSPSTVVQEARLGDETAQRSVPLTESAPIAEEDLAATDSDIKDEGFAGAGLPEVATDGPPPGSIEAIREKEISQLRPLEREDIPGLLEPISTELTVAPDENAEPALVAAFKTAPPSVHYFEKVNFENEITWILVASKDGKKMAWIFDENGTFAGILD